MEVDISVQNLCVPTIVVKTIPNFLAFVHIAEEKVGSQRHLENGIPAIVYLVPPALIRNKRVASIPATLGILFSVPNNVHTIAVYFETRINDTTKTAFVTVGDRDDMYQTSILRGLIWVLNPI